MRHRLSIVVLTASALAGCHSSPALGVDRRTDVLETEWAAKPHEPGPSSERPHQGGCATLVDAEGPDVLRIVGERGLALYADPQTGLAIVDISDPDAPTLLARSRFTGDPLGIFVIGDVATVVYQPWDRPPETAVRAVALRRGQVGTVVGEIVLDGLPRDARRAGDALVVTRDVFSGNEESSPFTAVSTFVPGKHGVFERDEVRLRGSGAVVGGAPWGIAVARQAERSSGPDRTAITWVGVSAPSGALEVGGTVLVAGVVSPWRRRSDHVIDVTEDFRVRLVGCTTETCAQGSTATYAEVDFAEPARGRLLASARLARAADAVFSFTADRLFVARAVQGSSVRDATEIAFYRTNAGLEWIGALEVQGTVASMTQRGEDHVVALGWTGDALTEERRAIVHDVDARKAPKLVGSTSFGADWTWSAAFDDDRALSLDPTFAFGALPMTTLRASRGVLTAVQVLSFPSSGPRALAAREVDQSDRLLFVDGRLLSFSADGVSVVSFPNEPGVRRHWDELEALGPHEARVQ